MAYKKKTKKQKKKNIVAGIAHIHTTFNNTIVTITDKEGNTIAASSAGVIKIKGSRKSTPFAAQSVSQDAAKKAMEHGLKEVEVFVKGPGAGRELAIKALQVAGLEIKAIQDKTAIAHGGVRLRKKPRN